MWKHPLVCKLPPLISEQSFCFPNQLFTWRLIPVVTWDVFLLKDHEDPPSQRLHAQHTISAGFQAAMPSSAKAMERRLSDLSIGHALKSVLLRYWFLLFLQTNGSGPMNHWQEVRPFISGGPLLCAPLKKSNYIQFSVSVFLRCHGQ